MGRSAAEELRGERFPPAREDRPAERRPQQTGDARTGRWHQPVRDVERPCVRSGDRKPQPKLQRLLPRRESLAPSVFHRRGRAPGRAGPQRSTRTGRESRGGEPSASVHPSSSKRPEPDDMLNMGALVMQGGEDPSPFVEADFTRVLEMESQPWLMATSGGAGLTAELAFGNGVPAHMRTSDKHEPLGTALFKATAEQEHPDFGSGCLSLLHLPVTLEPDAAANFANDLNASESQDSSASHLLGAWCSRGKHVSFASFLPTMLRALRILRAGPSSSSTSSFHG